MKKIIILVILLSAFVQFGLQAQTYKLTYEPRGKKFIFIMNDLRLYTDKESILKIERLHADEEWEFKDIHRSIESFDYKRNDSILIDINKLLNDTNKTKSEYSYKRIIVLLILHNHIKIFDKYNNQVKKLIFKEINSNSHNNKYFINKENNEILFEYTPILTIIDY